MNRAEAKKRMSDHLNLATRNRAQSLQAVKKGNPDRRTSGRGDSRPLNLLGRLERPREKILELREKGTPFQLGSAERAYSDVIRHAHDKLMKAIEAANSVEHWDGQVMMGNIARDIIVSIEGYNDRTSLQTRSIEEKQDRKKFKESVK